MQMLVQWLIYRKCSTNVTFIVIMTILYHTYIFTSFFFQIGRILKCFPTCKLQEEPAYFSGQQFYVGGHNDAYTHNGLCYRRGNQPREASSFMDSKHTYSVFQGTYFQLFLLHQTFGMPALSSDRKHYLYLLRTQTYLPFTPEGDTISKAIYYKTSLEK